MKGSPLLLAVRLGIPPFTSVTETLSVYVCDRQKVHLNDEKFQFLTGNFATSIRHLLAPTEVQLSKRPAFLGNHNDTSIRHLLAPIEDKFSKRPAILSNRDDTSIRHLPARTKVKSSKRLTILGNRNDTSIRHS